MADFKNLSDQELFKIAGLQPSTQIDQSQTAQLTNDELFKRAGIEPTEQNLGLNTLKKKILPTFVTGATPLPGERTLLGNIFERPGAAIREGVRSAASGDGFVKGYVKGSNEPEKSDTMQSQFIRQSQESFGGPSESVAVNFMKGIAPSAVGFVVDTVFNPADLLLTLSTGGGFKSAKSAGKVLSKTKSATKIPISKSIRPTVAGKANAGQIMKYNKNAATAVDAIVDNKKNLKYADDVGDIVKGKLPESLEEFSQAVRQTKKDIFNTYNKLARQSGEDMAVVFVDDIAQDLKKTVNTPAFQDVAPGVVNYADDVAKRLNSRGFYTIEDAQDTLQVLNNRLESFYKNPDPNNVGARLIDQMWANNLRKKLDDVIAKTTSNQYKILKQKYGALSAIEKDVARRAVVDGRRNPFGLLDFTDIFSGQQIIEGLATANPVKAGKGAVGMFIKGALKKANNPNEIVKKMFRTVDDIKTKGVIPSKRLTAYTARNIERTKKRIPSRREVNLSPVEK